MIHIGSAIGAFHHFICGPYKAGVFRRPLTHKLALAKAAAAALFAHDELRIAAADVKSSPILRTLFAPITLLASELTALRAEFAGGRYSAADIDAASASVAEISSVSASAGVPIKDRLAP